MFKLRPYFLALIVFLLSLASFSASSGDETPAYLFLSRLPSPADGRALSLTYGQVLDGPAPVYARPQDEAAGLPPVRLTGHGQVWVSLSEPEPVLVDGLEWYKINENEYLRADRLKKASPSDFSGGLVPDGFPGRFAWVLFATPLSSGPGLPVDENQPEVPARSMVMVYEIKEAEGRIWCRIGPEAWVPHQRLAMVTSRERPVEVGETERWLEVNLSEQTLAAYEGNRLIFATMISSGDARFPTIRGLFRIWAKVGLAKMSGGEDDGDPYLVEDVPWQMYFHRSYALHASYWHDFFGLPNSHGCVNLSPKDAAWLFTWTKPKSRGGKWQKASPADPGTWVLVHEEPVAVD